MKKIAAITMVRNDDFYLKKWVEYYSAQLGGKENLYIYFDGTDQVIAPFCDGTHTELVPKIGTQVVSGQTYCYLCKSTLGAKDRQDGYALCFVYINASGEAKYLKDDKIVLPGTENGGPALVGGWTYTETPDIKPDLREKIEATTARMLGTNITPEALIGTQVVAGANYAVLCRVSAVANGVGGATQYKLIIFNFDPEGNMTMTDVTDIQMGI